MANKVIEYIIRAKDKTGAGVDSALGKLRDMRKSATDTATVADTAGRNIGRGLGQGLPFIGRMKKKFAGVIGAFVAIGVAAGIMKSAMSKAFEFERYNTQFRVLLGGLDAAEARIKSLAAFSASTPFQLPDVITANKQLNVLSGGLLDTETNMQLVGDAASIAGQGISEVAMWFGRAYGAIRAGRPFGEAAQRLQEMGLLSGQARGEMENLQKSGASAASVFGVLQRELGTFSGGMKEASATGEGLTSTIKDNMTQAMAAFGKGAAEAAKGPMADLIEKMGELQDAGKFEDWGNNLVRQLENAIGLAEHMNTIINPAQILSDAAYQSGQVIYGGLEPESDEFYAMEAQRNKRKSDRAKEAADKKAEIDNAKIAADLDAADQERKGKAQNKLDVLGVVNPFAEQARLQIETEQASKRGKLEEAARVSPRNDDGTATLDVTDDLGKLNTDSAAGLELFVKAVAARAKKLESSAAAEEKSAAKEAASDAKRQADATKAAKEKLAAESKKYDQERKAPDEARAALEAEIKKLSDEIAGGTLAPQAEAEKGVELINKRRALDEIDETTESTQEKLATEQKKYDLEQMAPGDAQASIAAEIEKLGAEISGGTLSPLAEAEKGLEILDKKRALDSLQETNLGSGVKDFFLAGYGQESSENKVERNTGEMVEILKRMEKDAGLAE